MGSFKFLQNFAIGTNKFQQRWNRALSSGVCPYHFSHQRRKQVLPFVAEYHFDRYCGRKIGFKNDRHAKARKLYWRLHKNER